MTYRARWPIELGDLSSSVFQEKKKREKMEIKAIMTTWSTKSKTNFFTLSFLIYLTRDYRPSTARDLNDLVLKRRPLTSLVFHARIVFIWKNFKSLVAPAWIFWLQRYAISDSMHQRKYTFFCLLFIRNEFSLILCEQTNCTLHESRGLSRVDVAEKNYLEWL